MKAKKLTILSMMIALYIVLSILTPIKVISFKLTFEALPILISALLFGPIDGFVVGGLGSLVYQIFFSSYGLTPTTILWVLPHALSGLIVGLYAKNKKFELSYKQTLFITISSSIMVTILNSFALFVDAKIYGYYSFELVFGQILIKILVGIILSIIYSGLIPNILKIKKD